MNTELFKCHHINCWISLLAAYDTGGRCRWGLWADWPLTMERLHPGRLRHALLPLHSWCCNRLRTEGEQAHTLFNWYFHNVEVLALRRSIICHSRWCTLPEQNSKWMFHASRDLNITWTWLQRVPNIGAAVKKTTIRTLKMLFWGVLLQGNSFITMILSQLLFIHLLVEINSVTVGYDGIFICTKVDILMLRMTSLMEWTWRRSDGWASYRFGSVTNNFLLPPTALHISWQ